MSADVKSQSPAALLAHLQHIPMTEWVWHDAAMIFATLASMSASTSADDARAALFHLEVFAEGEDTKRIRLVIDALTRLTGIEQAAQRVLDDIDDCRSANTSVAALRTALATSRSQHEGAE